MRILRFSKPTEKTYKEWQKHYGLAEDYEMTAEEEGKMYKEFVPTMITDFPEMTLEYEQIRRWSTPKRLMLS